LEALPIYYYQCPHQFLRDAWLAKKSANSSFSMRSWAKTLGFANNSPLSLMLKGSRPIPKKYIPAFTKSLSLSAKEPLFLETLIDYSREKDIEMKEYYRDRLDTFSPRNKTIDRTEVDCLVVLKKLKLLQQDKSGQWVRSTAHIHNTPDVQSLGAQKYHQNASKYAIQAIENQATDEREFGSYSLNIKKSNMEKAKEIIRKFEMEFIKEVESPSGQGEETYQLNVKPFLLEFNSRSF